MNKPEVKPRMLKAIVAEMGSALVAYSGGADSTLLLKVALDILRGNVLAARSSKLNGHVERAQRTYTKEFYGVRDSSFEMPELNQSLLKWEGVYDTVRPSQALDYLIPQEYLEQYWQTKRKEVRCH